MSQAEGWDYGTIKGGYALFIGEGCDDGPKPVAVFRHEDDARRSVRALCAADAGEEGHRERDCHLHEVRNVQVPFWNNGICDPPADDWPAPTWDEADANQTILRLTQQRDGLREACQAALAFVEELRVPQDTLQAGWQVVRGSRLLDKVREALRLSK